MDNNRMDLTNGNVRVIQREDYRYGVTDMEGNVIVPFGKYNWIDGYDHGLARVIINTPVENSPFPSRKLGIINEKGEEVLPVEYDQIWNFYEKNRYSTRVVKDGVIGEVFFHDLNPELPVRGKSQDDWYYRPSYYYDEPQHYEEFAGTYAQDVAGYSDEEIYDAFDGEPDAYWNID